MTSANVPVIGLETSHSSSRSSDYDQQYDQIPFKMVDVQPIVSFRPQNFPLYVCQPLRLGGSSRTSESILSWSQLHINMLEIMAIRFALIKALKYIHHSCVMCLIYQQSRGNTFSQPMRRGMEDTSLVHKTSDYRQDLSYSRQIQCFGRQVIENRQTIMKTCLCNIDPLKPHFI